MGGEFIRGHEFVKRIEDRGGVKRGYRSLETCVFHHPVLVGSTGLCSVVTTGRG